MTPAIRDRLREATEVLKRAGVDTPTLDAELLLAHALGVARSWLLAHPEQHLTPEQEAAFRALLARRTAREPLAYITGQRAFYDIQLEVTPAVLTPRPETEELVERALTWLRERPRAVVVDVGTGSGAIALTVARHASQSRVYAIDISPQALDVARRNARRLGLTARVAFLLGDLLAPLPEPVDIILANLPYIPEGVRTDLMPEVAAFEPPEALFSGERGLDHIARLLAQAPAFLRPGGRILLEMGCDQADEVLALARQSFPRADRRVIQDLTGRDRFLAIALP
ncbi:MAG TPA: peptide chain release factor N(5)-glutamine methyltransferase [Anaerolineae bacterium]|nr:peptide chain release factor N(5)-glutamine methyltransferase [Caldilineae bacterium]HID34654.1 peptide chain release factor N(5)-glutamine methyltransferase [Anaerolineae bacterium]HIQ12155.1 peptide chain release factor N(5)-glutamine methyltransferase [Caldilineales bacterium]